jgi:hypothetical protein
MIKIKGVENLARKLVDRLAELVSDIITALDDETILVI